MISSDDHPQNRKYITISIQFRMKQRSFKTSLGTEYTISIPESQPKSHSPGSPVFVAPDGTFLDVFQNPVPGSLSLSQFPLPTDFDSYNKFRSAALEWQKAVDSEVQGLLLPVPLGFEFEYPGAPHVPTPQEKVPMSIQNRMASKAFSVSATPLYPENYLTLAKYVVRGDTDEFENFPVPGPRGQKIPFDCHFRKDLPWGARLRRVKPTPEMYENYDEYADAMKNWYLETVEDDIVPMHAEDFASMLNVDKQNEGEIASEVDVMPTAQLSRFPQAVLTSEHKVSGTLELLYNELFTEKSDRSMPLSFGPRCVQCKNALDELMQYGAYSPKRNKDFLLGLAWNSCYPCRLPSVNDRSMVTIVLDLYDIGYHKWPYYQYLREVFNSPKSDVKDCILSDLRMMYKCYRIFGEFNDCISGNVEFFDFECFSELFEESSGVVVTFHNIFMGLYMSLQMVEVYSEGEEGRICFERNSKMLHEMGKSFLEPHRAFLSALYERMPVPCMKLLMELLYVVIEIDVDMDVYAFLDCFSESIFMVLLRVSELAPEVFDVFAVRAAFSKRICHVLFRQLSVLTLSPMRLLVPNGDRIVRFITNLVNGVIKSVAESKSQFDVSWVLVFVTGIVNILVTDNTIELRRLLLAIFEFCKFADFGGRLPQLESVLFSAFSISHGNDVLLCLLKCLKRVIPNKETNTFLLQIRGIGDMLAKHVANENVEVSCHAVKVVREILIFYPNEMLKMFSSDAHGALVEAFRHRKWRVNLEIFKLIERTMAQHSNVREAAPLNAFLRQIGFRYSPALSNARDVVDNRRRHVVDQFEQLLSRRSNIVSFLSEIEKSVKG